MCSGCPSRINRPSIRFIGGYRCVQHRRLGAIIEGFGDGPSAAIQAARAGYLFDENPALFELTLRKTVDRDAAKFNRDPAWRRSEERSAMSSSQSKSPDYRIVDCDEIIDRDRNVGQCLPVSIDIDTKSLWTIMIAELEVSNIVARHDILDRATRWFDAVGTLLSPLSHSRGAFATYIRLLFKAAQLAHVSSISCLDPATEVT